MSTTMTVRLEENLKDRLEKLAKATKRSKSFLVAEAIREFIELNEWQVGELKLTVQEADSDDFASGHEVNELFGRWGVSNGDYSLPGKAKITTN